MTEYIGSQVSVPGTRGKAILRYYGPINGKQGTFAGLELLGPIALTRGKNSGDVDGVQYFEVQLPNSGLFIPYERLKAANPQLDLTPVTYSRPASGMSTGAVTPRRPSYESRQSVIPPVISVSKRGERTPSKLGSPSLRSLSSSEFRTSADYSTRLNSSSFVEQELMDLRQKYEKSEREMSQKLSILNELKQTVDDLQPLLKQYESELSDKDKKIYKLKTDFDSAREEWRQNLDIMVNTYEENENFYELKIKQLQLKVSETSTAPVEVSELHQKIEQLTEEKIELESSLNSKILSLEANIKELETSKEKFNKGNDDIHLSESKEIERLTEELNQKNSSEDKVLVNELKNIREDLNKLSIELEESKTAQAKLREEKEVLQKEVEANHAAATEETPNKVLDNQVRSLRQENDSLVAQIIGLKEELVKISNENLEIKKEQEETMNNQIEINGNSAGNLKVKELEEDLFYKQQEIQALGQQLEKTASIVKSQKQHIRELETKTQSDRGAEMNTEELKSEFEKDKDNFIHQLNSKDNIIKELERKLQESLEHELDNITLSDVASISENNYKREIEELKKELDARPTMEELIELQDNIDEMLRLHNNELYFKEEEINKLNHENNKLQTRLERVLEGSIYARTSDMASHESNSVLGDLPVYQPEVQLDPSTGKENWCGLCERSGHNSLNCPYENDIF